MKKQEEKESLSEEAQRMQKEAMDSVKQGVEEEKEAHEETEKEEEPVKEKGPSFFQRMSAKREKLNDTVSEKYPRIYKTSSYIGEVWRETFPDNKKKASSRLQQRKEEAQEYEKMVADYDSDEAEAAEAAIPDWKKGAMTVTDNEPEEKKAGLFKRAVSSASTGIGGTKFVKNLAQTEEFKEFKKQYTEVKEDMTDFTEKLRDEVETTENKGVSFARDAGSILFHESNTSKAVRTMKVYDQTFDLMDLHHESSEIFVDFYNAFLRGDLEYIQKFASGPALAIVKAEMKIREEGMWEQGF